MDCFSVDIAKVWRGNSSRAACAGCSLLAAGDKPVLEDVGERILLDVLTGVVMDTDCILFLRSRTRAQYSFASF